MSSATIGATLTPEQFGERYGISTRNVIKLITRGDLTAINVGVGRRNKRWRIRPEDIERFEARRVHTPAARPARRRRHADDANYTKFFQEQ